MSFVCSNLRAAKKRYRCYLCGERIDVGERHEYRSGVGYECGFFAMRLHPECAEEVDNDRDFEWECFDEHSLKRPMTAFCPEI